MTVKLGMTHQQLINAINSDIGLIKDQGSKIITKEFPASETETSSVQLDTKCQGKDYMFVFMDYGILEPSQYSLSADGLTVNFSPAIPANHKIIIRYFTPGSSFTNYVTDEFQSNLLNYTTNRILEIPQDIKLEINSDKRLVLKAGSKLYYPNGFEEDGKTRKFDTFIADNNVISVKFGVDREVLVVYSFHTNNFEWSIRNSFSSGNTQPTDSWYVWYDTETNFIRWTDGTSNGICTFPICILTENPESASGLHDGGVKSIDQIFNGFGYIGSHFFVLPGVKVQIPDERNEDGSYKTFSVKTNSVTTVSFPNTVSGGMNWYINNLGNAAYYGSNYIKFSENNLWESTDDLNYIVKGVVVATSDVTSGVISNYKSCIVDSVANSNASNFSPAGRSYLSGLGMPSNKYIDLTLGASGTKYTAPANGYFMLRKKSSTNTRQFLSFNSDGFNVTNETYLLGAAVGNIFPCIKGREVEIGYTLGGETLIFRFYYAQGDQ